jgi:predicted permease
MTGLLHDLRHGLRLFHKRIGFTAVAVLTIGVGVAATTTVFSVVEGTLLRPWPFPGSERLAVILATWPERGVTSGSVNYADYEDWREAEIFEHVTVFRHGARDLADGSGEPERIRTLHHSADFFETLGVAATLGRVPEAAEYGVGAPVSVVGVMSPELDVLPAPLFVPLRPTPRRLVGWRDRDSFGFNAYARLRPGQTLDQARAQLVSIAQRIEADYPQLRAGTSADIVPLSDRIVGNDTRTILWVMLGAVGFVLLIGCVNLANLQLAGATKRQREMAVRAAIGAGRFRLVRQLVSESLALALAGGAVGVLLALWGIRLVTWLAPSDVPRIDHVSMNASVLGFALLISIGSALIFGLFPAFRATRQGPSRTLADAAFGSTTGPQGRRTLGALVACELALAVVLLAGAGLMLRSVASLRDVDPGFDVEDLVTFRLTLPSARYEWGQPLADAYAQLRGRLEAVPGVESAVAMSTLPLGGGGFILFRAHLPEGRPEPPDGEEVSANWDVVQPSYFETMRLPLIAGRGFTEADTDGSLPVMIVNREFARVMFGSTESALGKRIRSWRDENIYREIVGVVDNVRYFGAGDEIRSIVYIPHRQVTWRAMSIAVRTARGGDVGPEIRAAVADFDPNVALASFTTMSRIFEDSIAERRFAARTLTGFATLALLLAAIGIYGVLSYAVAQRTREFGVRMALGAKSNDVLGMVLRDAAITAIIGTSLGLVGAIALTRVMSGLLHGVSATDPVTFATAVAVLGSVAFAASLIPAVRATRVDPMKAMRPE